MTRKGFTLIELLVVFVIIGILVNIAIPALQGAKQKATAAVIVGDLNVIRAAAFAYFDDAGRFPGNGKKGVVPPELVPFLPENFAFSRSTAEYRWKRSPAGKKKNKFVTVFVEVRSKDQKLLQALRGLYGNAISGGGKNKIKILIAE